MSFTTLEFVKGERVQIVPPDYVNDTRIALSDNSIKVLEKRYLRRDVNDDPLETPAGMFYRVAYVVGNAWPELKEVPEQTRAFYNLMTERRFFPNSPTFTGAGTGLGQLAACFVLPLEDDMGGQEGGIFDTLKNAALIQQTGGGVGFSFSRLRPQGDSVASSGGKATGPLGFLRVYDAAFGEVAQGGTRRGANMGILRVDHPDIEEFIECKAKENQISNFNISVGITDEFMRAVERGSLFELINPKNKTVWKTIDARALFSKIVHYAYRNGEPGLVFLDAANRSNPVPHLYTLEATNPCGEQWLGPYENCCLGSINLAVMFDGAGIDWALLQQTVIESVDFLDSVVTANKYVPAVPELKEAADRARRIGLGIMGLADLMYKLGVRYGSAMGQDLAAQIMEFVRYWAMRQSIELAKRFGAFPAIKNSIYDFDGNAENFWEVPNGVAGSNYLAFRFGRPDLDWAIVRAGLMGYGIRNAAQTTVAPTGTIATVMGCEGYGCEPVFALGYIRHFKDGDKDIELVYTSPLFEEALDDTDLSASHKAAIKQHVATYGSCQGIVDLPEYLRHTFVVSSDITAEEHVRMQAAIQAFIDNSISKTCNFPEGATEEDVAKAYQLAWELGCKGLTVYVTGSRQQVVLETKATQQKKNEGETPTPLPMEHAKRPRPPVLAGRTHRKQTPAGTAYVTVNSDERNEPFEVFLNVGKAGSEVAAVSEAIGRLISLALRLPSTVTPTERVAEIVDELTAIGGSRPLGFGNGRVLSLPDGIAQALRVHMTTDEAPEEAPQHTKPHAFGDICPECGEASFLNVEGCRKCFACGYSEC